MIKTTKELYRIFELLNKSLFGEKLTEPIIIIQSSKKAFGTFWGDSWLNKQKQDNMKNEITINPEHLNRPTEETIGTLLHEMVHLYCHMNNIKDTSNMGIYHNKRFKEESELHGLIVEKSERYGYAHTKLNDTTKELLKSFNIDESCFEYYRRTYKGSLSKPLFKYECPDCKLKLSHYKQISLICGICNKNLVERD